MRRAFVAGWPARHSRSPLIHAHWLAEHGIEGAYEIAEIAPEDFSAFLAEMPARGYVGGNVTLPHKHAALAAAGEADATARAIGAANTLWLEEGRLRATNTDGYGFTANLDEAAPGWDRPPLRALVLGAGGAARAVLHALLGRGAGRIDVVNRTLDRAEALAEAFGPTVAPAEWSALPLLLGQADLLVNTTSLGMVGHEPLAVDLAALKSGAVVNDLVYAPLETALLRQARAGGHRAADGLGMLLHQAVPGFELWFGTRPAVTAALRRRIEADLAR